MHANDLTIYHILIFLQTTSWYAFCWKRCKILKCRGLKSFYFLMKNRVLIWKDSLPSFFEKMNMTLLENVMLYRWEIINKYFSDAFKIKKSSYLFRKSLQNIKVTASPKIIFSKPASVKTAFFFFFFQSGQRKHTSYCL